MRPSTTLTRSQQRTQKRQAWILVLLVLGVAVGSFALGVVVGRSSLPATQDQRAELAVLPMVRPVPPPPQDVAQPEPAPISSSTVHAEAATAVSGEKPVLGSGINVQAGCILPPSTGPVSGANSELSPPVKESVAVKTATKGAATNPDQLKGASVFQVLSASFPARKDAEDFSRRLERKGYHPAISTSDVRGKEWYQVSVGPYENYESAKAAAEKLQREERVSPVIRKRRP